VVDATVMATEHARGVVGYVVQPLLEPSSLGHLVLAAAEPDADHPFLKAPAESLAVVSPTFSIDAQVTNFSTRGDSATSTARCSSSTSSRPAWRDHLSRGGDRTMRTVDPVMHLVAVLGRGVIDDPDEPVLSAFDVGLTRGDGCFDAMRIEMTADGSVHIDHLDAHLDRLVRSARALDLPPVDVDAWRELIAEALAEWRRPGEAVLRVLLSRGSEWSAAESPTGMLTIAPLAESARAHRGGISVITLSLGRRAEVGGETGWLLGGVKTLSYAVNMAAAREAARRGADDALFVSTDGLALEGPRAALIWRVGDGVVTTRVDGTGILASITQSSIFAEAARDGIETGSGLIEAARLPTTDGAWLVSSGRLVAPILALDGVEMACDPAWTQRLNGWATR
jgi:4-amino-4-deoxychorismate lyase